MRKIISFLLSICLIICAAPGVSAFPDIADAQVNDAAECLRLVGIIDGFGDGTFRPDEYLTRAQICKLAVTAAGALDATGQYKSYTIFPDVRGVHWASGIINYSVRVSKIISGFPDGTFRPDETVTFAQALAILIRLLGYESSEVGLVWPDGYMDKAAEIGLSKGFSLSAETKLRRGDTAKLFYNLLTTKQKSGTEFISTLGEALSDILVLDVNASVTGSSEIAVKVLEGGKIKLYKTPKKLPEAYVRQHGDLYLREDDSVLTFLPSWSSNKDLTVSEALSTGLRFSDGSSMKVSKDTVFMLGDELKTFGDVWYIIPPGISLTVFYTKNGDVDFISAAGLLAAGVSKVMNADIGSAGELSALFGAPSSGAAVYRNGRLSSAADIKKFDVVTYNEDSNAFFVSSVRLTGYYEEAYPNRDSPETAKFFGVSYPVAEEGSDALSEFKPGNKITVFFTSGGEIAGAVDTSALTARMVGLAVKAGEITLSNGLTLKASLVSGKQFLGKPVSVVSNKSGEMSLIPLDRVTPVAPADLKAGTIGDLKITQDTVFYESVGPNGAARQIDRSDILADLIPKSKIFRAESSSGEVSVVWMDDVTGDTYNYGFPLVGTTRTEIGDADNPSYLLSTTMSVKTSSGIIDNIKFYGTAGDFDSYIPVGISLTNEREYVSTVRLTEIKNVKRFDFSSDDTHDYVTAGGEVYRIAGDVSVYDPAAKAFISPLNGETLIEHTRKMSGNMTVFVDKKSPEDGKVRMIFVY